MSEEDNKFRFKTGPVVVSRAYLEPCKEPNKHGRWTNTLECFPDADNKLLEMRKAVVECAKDAGAKVDEKSVKQIYAPIFKRLENTAKDTEKNEHLEGKTFFTMIRSRSPKDRDLKDPAVRKEWVAYMANERPKAYFINKDKKRELIPIEKMRDFIYPGCVVNAVGEAYWSSSYNRVCIDLQAVVLLEQRDRIGPAPRSRNDDDDELLNEIAEASKNQGDDLDGLFGDSAVASEEDIPF